MSTSGFHDVCTGMRSYESVLLIDDIPPFAEEFDGAILDRLGRILIRSEYAELFGICLLHRHFDLNDEELLVEKRNDDGLLISPESYAAADNLFPVAWRINSADSVTPVQWGRGLFRDGNKERDIHAFFQSEAVHALHDVLSQTNCTTKYGIAVELNTLDIGSDAMYLEQTLLAERELHISVVPRTFKRDKTVVETNWLFRPDTIPVMGCRVDDNRWCKRECVRTCKNRGGGESGRHDNVHESTRWHEVRRNPRHYKF